MLRATPGCRRISPEAWLLAIFGAPLDIVGFDGQFDGPKSELDDNLRL
jgi:hypothetical protein